MLHGVMGFLYKIKSKLEHQMKKIAQSSQRMTQIIVNTNDWVMDIKLVA